MSRCEKIDFQVHFQVRALKWLQEAPLWGAPQCTSFSGFLVLNRVNILHLIHTGLRIHENPQSSILNPHFLFFFTTLGAICSTPTCEGPIVARPHLGALSLITTDGMGCYLHQSLYKDQTVMSAQNMTCFITHRRNGLLIARIFHWEECHYSMCYIS